MKIEEIKLPSVQDALPIAVWVALPEEETAKAVFQISHGMSEHKGRYRGLMEYLCQNGFACVIHDHRGHGESVRSQEDYGYFYRNGAESLVEDLHQVTLYAQKRFSGLPFFLFGHSMGSMIVRSYLKRYDGELDGLIVCGSPSYNQLAGVGRVLAGTIGGLRGGRHRSGFLQKLSFGSFNKKFGKTQSENSWISSSDEEVEAYDGDPQCGFVFTANGFRNLYKLMQNTYSKKGWELHHPKLPVYFISGGDDPCLISEEKFRKTVAFLKERGYENVTCKLYPGKRHEILNEDVRPQVFSDIKAFCEAQM